MIDVSPSELLNRVRNTDYKANMHTACVFILETYNELKLRVMKHIPPSDSSLHRISNLIVLVSMLGLSFIAPIFVTFLAIWHLTYIHNKKHKYLIMGSTLALDIFLCWFLWIPGVIYSVLILFHFVQFIPFWTSTTKIFDKLNSNDEKRK